MMPTRTHVVPLGELVCRPRTWNPAREALGEQIDYIDLSSVDNETKSISSGQRIFAADAPSRARQLVKSGDILVSTVRPNLNGVARVPTELNGATASTGFCVLRPVPEKLLGEYLLQWVRTPIFVGDMVRKATGASYPAVSDRIILESAIPLPSLSEQRRIAAILDEADGLRRKRRQGMEKLNGFIRAIFLETFGDPILNARQWPTRILGEVGQLERGVSKHRPRNDPALLNGAYPFIQTGDIANCDGYIREYTSCYSEIGLRQSRLWPKGTLCITIAANIGKTGILLFDACFPDSVVGFTPSNLVTTEYVQSWMSFVQRKLEDDAPEFAQKNINLAILRDLTIPVPPIKFQADFAARVSEIDQLGTAYRMHSAKLDTLFMSLQHRAFQGEL